MLAIWLMLLRFMTVNLFLFQLGLMRPVPIAILGDRGSTAIIRQLRL